jgi:sigma-B regulation protein RsbQ
MPSNVLRRNNVHVTGQGDRALVFAHGFGCEQGAWQRVAPAFEADHRVVLFDYVGSGRSDISAYDPQRYSDLHGYAQDLIEVCAALDLSDAVLVGHSVSGMIGLLAAVRAPQHFERLIMIGPSPRYLDDPPHYAGGFNLDDMTELLDLMERNSTAWAGFLAPVAMRNADRPELAAELSAMFCANDPVTTQHFARAVFLSDHRADLPLLRQHALVLQCSDDPIAPDSVGAYMQAHLPRATLVHMQGGGHCPHMSHPDDTIAAIRSYLASPV